LWGPGYAVQDLEACQGHHAIVNALSILIGAATVEIRNAAGVELH